MIGGTEWGYYSFLREEHGVELSFERLSDCGHFYGTRDFTAPTSDLLAPDEYARLCYQVFAEDGPSADRIQALLFCAAQFLQ